MDWQEAERICCNWMRRGLAPDARLTQMGADGGVDIRSRDFFAQVKAHARPIGRPDVQGIAGAALAEGRVPVIFSLSGLTAQAEGWADEAGVAYFLFDASGFVQPENQVAHALLADRVGERVRESGGPPESVVRIEVAVDDALREQGDFELTILGEREITARVGSRVHDSTIQVEIRARALVDGGVTHACSRDLATSMPHLEDAAGRVQPVFSDGSYALLATVPMGMGAGRLVAGLVWRAAVQFKESVDSLSVHVPPRRSSPPEPDPWSGY